MSNVFYDAEAVGEILRVTVVTLCIWRRKRVGPEWFKRGQFIYYRAEQLQEYLDRIGPIPEGMDLPTKRRFFTNAHRPTVTPEGQPVPSREELAARLAVVEKTLAIR